MSRSQELEWGGGLKQRDNKEARKEEFLRIAAQPFARFEPDEKYMQELKPGKRSLGLGVTDLGCTLKKNNQIFATPFRCSFAWR